MFHSTFADGLPFELLSTIFSICVRHRNIQPEHLSWVNRYWRRVALNSAKLWTDVYYGAEIDIPRMLVYLERSCHAPLRVEMDVTRATLIEEVSASCLISILSPHFHRVQAFSLAQFDGWRTVEPPYNGSNVDFARALSNFLQNIHPSTRGVSLQAFGIYTERQLSVTLPSFLENAQLRHLDSENIDFRSMKMALEASSHSLVSLRLIYDHTSEFCIDQFISVSRTFHHLRELEINLSDDVLQPVSKEFETVLLPALTSLIIFGNLSTLLPYLVCPVLHTFSPCALQDDMTTLGPLLDFLALHSKTIVTLDFQSCHIGDDTTENSYAELSIHSSRFPALTSLSGSFVSRPASFVLGLIKGSCLTNVDIRVYWDISMISLLDFFDAASDTLQTANISYEPNWGSGGAIHESILLTRRIVFACLESFTSWCRLGDAVVSATKEAPQLRTLQLHGPLVSREVSEPSTWVTILFSFFRMKCRTDVYHRRGWRMHLDISIYQSSNL